MRTSQTTRISVYAVLAVVAGQNLPAALLHLTLGERVEPFPAYTVGAMTVRAVLDIPGPLEAYADAVTEGRSGGTRR